MIRFNLLTAQLSFHNFGLFYDKHAGYAHKKRCTKRQNDLCITKSLDIVTFSCYTANMKNFLSILCHALSTKHSADTDRIS